MQFEKRKRKKNKYKVSWKTPVLKWLLLVAVHCLSRPMGSLHSSVLTRFLGQKLQVPRILGAAQYSAQQCSAINTRLAGQVRADCYAWSEEKKRSSQFNDLNNQLCTYKCLRLLNICAQWIKFEFLVLKRSKAL